MSGVRVDPRLLRVPGKVDFVQTAAPVVQQQQQYYGQQPEEISHPEMWHEDNSPPGKGEMNRGLSRKLFAPYPHFTAMVMDGRALLRAGFLELVSAFFISTVVSNIASMALGPDVSLRSLVVGVAQFLVMLCVYGWRNTSYLPRHGHPGVTFIQWMEDKCGLFVALVVYLAPGYAGACLSGPLLAAIGGSFVPDYTTALRPVSLAGAVGLEILFGTFVLFAFIHNHAIKRNKTGLERETSHHGGFSMQTILTAAAYPLATFCTFGNGLMYQGNPLMYIGSAVNLGGNVGGNVYWAYPVFVYPLVCGILAWALHYLTWNVNNLSDATLRVVAAEEQAQTNARGASNDYIAV